MLSIRQTIDRLAGLLARNGPRVYTQYMYNYCISRRILFLQAERWTRRYSTRTRYQTVDVQGCGLVISAVLYVRVIFFSSICMLDLTQISGRHSNSLCDRIEKKNRWYAQPFSKQEIDHDRAANDMLACVRCVRPWLVRHDTTGISLTNDLMLIYSHSGARTVFCETCEDFAPKYRHQTPRLLFELVLVE